MDFKKLAFLAAALYSQCSFSESVYSVGNSLIGNGVPDFVYLRQVNGGMNPEAGYHIRYGAPLNYIRANPTDVSLTQPPFGSYGNYLQALPNNRWDNVLIEPFPGADFGTHDTLGSDTANISYFIDLTKSSGLSNGAKFFIYEAWPNQTAFSGDYSAYWDQSVSADASQPMVFARQYFDALYANLSASYGAASISVIPVGDVLRRIDQDIKDGLLPEIPGIAGVYIDDYHMDGIGLYVAAATVYSVLTQSDPRGTVVPPWFLAGPVPLGLAQKLQSAVWDVVSTDPRAGVVPVPIPAAAWLFACAIGLLGKIGFRAKASMARMER